MHTIYFWVGMQRFTMLVNYSQFGYCISIPPFWTLELNQMISSFTLINLLSPCVRHCMTLHLFHLDWHIVLPPGLSNCNPSQVLYWAHLSVHVHACACASDTVRGEVDFTVDPLSHPESACVVSLPPFSEELLAMEPNIWVKKGLWAILAKLPQCSQMVFISDSNSPNELASVHCWASP